MKVFANLTSYNEEYFINEVVASIHDFVDYICIIDVGMENIVSRGASLHSNDKSVEIVKAWQNKSKKIHLIQPKDPPKTFPELGMYGLNLAKELKCDWFFSVGLDEIYDKNCIIPMRNILANCERNGIMGINLSMYGFCPDFYHYYDFYNPRIGRITDDCTMPFSSCDILYWPKLKAWQSIELDRVPEYIRKINFDYPKFLKVFHYTCVGKERIKFKYEFYKTYKDNIGAEHYEHYMNKDWDYFKNVMKCKEFTGKHPEIMQKHPLFNEKLY
ncbi:hypothetical protein HYV49_03400 [Candidatus Pacearchaeota archaeon]|nr:hypothetical protein [Candidatus Pacearchaeota archaeon]